jgi:hypothetical protein
MAGVDYASAISSIANSNSSRGGGSGIGPQFNYTNSNKQNAKAGFMNLLDPGNTFMSIWNKQDGTEYDPYAAYTPEQKAIHQTLGPYLKSMMNGQLNLYGGNYTAPLSPGEQDVISQNARMSALGEQGLADLLKGKFPEQYYQDTLYAPALKQFQQDTQPQLEEQYAGNGGYWGSARANAVAKGYRDLGDTLAAKRAELAWNVAQNVPNAINAANALSTTGAAIQSTPRLIQQYGLDQQYNDWVRANNANQKYIDQALNFMGISSGVQDVGNTAIPGSGVDLGSIANLIGQFAGSGNSSTTTPTGNTGGYFSPVYNYNYSTPSSIDYGTATGNLGSTLNTYSTNALGNMDWKNNGNYSALGGF